MKKILVVTASPLAENSVSCQLAGVFMKNYQEAHPEDQLKCIDLSRLELPEIDEELIAYFNGQSDSDNGAYTEIDTLCEEFMAADKTVFALPHWNLIVPPKMISYSLAVMRAGRSFRYTEKGPRGALFVPFNLFGLILLFFSIAEYISYYYFNMNIWNFKTRAPSDLSVELSAFKKKEE